MAPSGWGQVLARARACPPVLEVDIPISPCGGDPCPESHSPHRQWLPSNNIACILIAFLFLFWSFYQKTYSLYGGNALFPCLWVIWDWRVMYTCFYTQNMDPMTAVFGLSTTILSEIFEFLCLTIWFGSNTRGVYFVPKFYNCPKARGVRTENFYICPNSHNVRECNISNFAHFVLFLGSFLK